jgi:hypothetical protein
MRRFVVLAIISYLVFVGFVLRSAIKDFLWTHPWWHSFLVGVPTIAVPILAYLELLHSSEANKLRAEGIVLQRQITNLTADLDSERNKHLEKIANNTDRPITKAERNAAILRKHLRSNVPVSEGQNTWSGTPEIVELSEDNIVTLFTPRSYSSSTAWCVRVHCDDLEITEIPLGSCPIRLRVIKRYGPDVQLGEITQWEDRFQQAATVTFAKGGPACWATYSKPGSPEKRSLYVYGSSDGSNSFLLEASSGEKIPGDNVEISKWFMVLQAAYEAAGFGRTNFGTGGASHGLLIH